MWKNGVTVTATVAITVNEKQPAVQEYTITLDANGGIAAYTSAETVNGKLSLLSAVKAVIPSSAGSPARGRQPCDDEHGVLSRMRRSTRLNENSTPDKPEKPSYPTIPS